MQPFMTAPRRCHGGIDFAGCLPLLKYRCYFLETGRYRLRTPGWKAFCEYPRCKKRILEGYAEGVFIIRLYIPDELVRVHCFKRMRVKIIFEKRIELIA